MIERHKHDCWNLWRYFSSFFPVSTQPYSWCGFRGFPLGDLTRIQFILRTYPVDFSGNLCHADDFRLQAIDRPGSHVTGRVTTVTTSKPPFLSAVFCSHANLFLSNIFVTKAFTGSCLTIAQPPGIPWPQCPPLDIQGVSRSSSYDSRSYHPHRGGTQSDGKIRDHVEFNYGKAVHATLDNRKMAIISINPFYCRKIENPVFYGIDGHQTKSAAMDWSNATLLPFSNGLVPFRLKTNTVKWLVTSSWTYMDSLMVIVVSSLKVSFVFASLNKRGQVL